MRLHAPVASTGAGGEASRNRARRETRHRSYIEALCKAHSLKVCNEFIFRDGTTPTMREIPRYKAVVEIVKDPRFSASGLIPLITLTTWP